MVKFLTDLVIQLISNVGYLGIAIAMTFESACIPIPSEVILPFGGFLVFQGRLTFWGVVFAGTIGGTIGSIVAYLVGLWGGRPFILKYGKYFFVSKQKFDKSVEWFDKYGEVTVFTTRLMPIIRTFISLPAGIAKMNFVKFLVLTFLGSLPWSIVLTYIGVKLGQNWESVSRLFHYADIAVVLFIVVIIIYFTFKNKNKK